MRPVNLLPEEYRPRRRGGGGRSGSAYVVVGALVALLAMVTLYVLTSNQIDGRRADAAQARSDAERARAEMTRLGPFGNFNQIKEVRVASVKSLAQQRFDWERFVRELALVLPRGSWLSEVDASASGEPSAGAAAPAGAGAGGPSAKLAGCAPRQPDVAKLMVRLRKMHRVEDVELKESAHSGEAGGAGAAAAAAPAPAATPAGPAAGGDCTERYKFDLLVRFAEARPTTPGDGTDKVPASLGGGQ